MIEAEPHNSESNEVTSTCYQCLQQSPHCFCAQLQKIPNKTELRIFQHPREFRHPLGTAIIAMLGFQRINRHFAMGISPDPEQAQDAVLLFPSPNATPLMHFQRRPSQLWIIDGTWRQTKKLYRENPWLQAMPCATLTPENPSTYRLRRAPGKRYLSTFESMIQALRILEPDTPFDALQETFERMVAHQWESQQDKSTCLDFRPKPSWFAPLFTNSELVSWDKSKN